MKSTMLLALLTTLLLGASCSSINVREEIEIEKKELSEINSSEKMMQKSYDIVELNENISPEKKAAFNELKAKVYQDVQKINQDIARSKVILFRALLEDNEKNQKKIDILIQDLKTHHDRKLNIMIEAFFQVRDLLEHNMLERMLNERFHDYWFREG